MVHFSLNIKACCLYVISEEQDQIWTKIFCIPKNMHSRTPMVPSSGSAPLATPMVVVGAMYRYLALSTESTMKTILRVRLK